MDALCVNEYAIDFDDHSIPEKVWIWSKDKAEHAGAEVVDVLSISKDHKYLTYMTDNRGEDGSRSALNINMENTFPFESSQLKDWENLTYMNDLHEPALLELLHRRYGTDKIYTYSGDVVISINPYKTIEGLYDLNKVVKKSEEEVHMAAEDGDSRWFQPHLYSVAQIAYDRLQKEEPSNQSILVNGESGSGKTEACKYIMRYLTKLTKSTDNVAEETVLQSNPLLEAFGNAVTIRNNNSSRFGKFVTIDFADDAITGARIKHFLLEKSRIVAHSAGERNYHIFYQMCAGLQENERYAHLGLKDASNFAYLQPTGDFVDDSLEGTVEAMKAVGLSDEDCDDIWKILAAILHLGNVRFLPKPEKEEESTIDQDSVSSLQYASDLLGLEPEILRQNLLLRHIGGRASIVEIPLNVNDAIHSRNGLAKTLYGFIFDWLVAQINNRFNYSTSSFIGILDIFGFEVLGYNSFEQLCVNYANEILQKLFNEHVFELEKSRYERQGINHDFLKFKNNQELIDCFESPTSGIFPLLEEQGLLGSRASDDAYLSQVSSATVNSQFVKPDRFGRKSFVVKHFAADVMYEVQGFLDKNNDALHGDLVDIFTDEFSTNVFLTRYFASSVAPATPFSRSRAGVPQRKLASLTSVSGRFRSQMFELTDTLSQTDIQFVRCIKPNDLQLPNKWNAKLVLNQLRHLGIMEAVRIRQEGFPVSRTFQDVVRLFAQLEKHSDEAELPAKCVALLREMFGDESENIDWQLGTQETVFMTKAAILKINRAIQALMDFKQRQLQVEREREAREQLLLRLAAEERARLEREEAERKRLEEERRLREEQERKEEEERLRLEKLRREEEEKRLAEEQRIKDELAKKKALEENNNKIRFEKIAKVQAWWRMVTTQRSYRSMLVRRMVWKQVLHPNESIVLASFVVHTTEFESLKRIGLADLLKKHKRRGLVLTTDRRLLLVNTYLGKYASLLDAKLDRKCHVKILSDKSFEMILGPDTKMDETLRSKVWIFTDLLGRSEAWQNALERMPTVYDIVNNRSALKFDSSEPVLIQGFLKKHAIRRGKNWRQRWFVLQGHELRWYKSGKQTTPQGYVTLNEQFDVRIGADRNFVIHGPNLNNGLYIECPSKVVCVEWVSAISGVIARPSFAYDA